MDHCAGRFGSRVAMVAVLVCLFAGAVCVETGSGQFVGLPVVGGQRLPYLELTGVGVLSGPTLKVSSGHTPVVEIYGPSQQNVEGTIGFYRGANWMGQMGYGDVCGSGEPALSKAMGICSYLGYTTLGTSGKTTLIVRETGRVGIGTVDPLETLDVRGNARVEGNLTVTGVKQFACVDPDDADRTILYAALEGPEAGTYVRGTATLTKGRAEIVLPEHFAAVTSASGCTVQLTPVGGWLELYVIEKGPGRLVVGEAEGRDGSFDYLVQGVRAGYENYQPVEQ